MAEIGYSYAYLRKQPETAERLGEILGLPDERWTELHVEFGADEVATATVTLLLRADQLIALAELAAVDALRSGSDCVAED